MSVTAKFNRDEKKVAQIISCKSKRIYFQGRKLEEYNIVEDTSELRNGFKTY